MHILLVDIQVKPEYLEAFIAATRLNASSSREEPGIVRFDFLQNSEDPTRFSLVEVYRTADDVLKHKETAHYAVWRDTVTDMMARPRVGVRYTNLDPGDAGWE